MRTNQLSRCEECPPGPLLAFPIEPFIPKTRAPHLLSINSHTIVLIQSKRRALGNLCFNHLMIANVGQKPVRSETFHMTPMFEISILRRLNVADAREATGVVRDPRGALKSY